MYICARMDVCIMHANKCMWSCVVCVCVWSCVCVCVFWGGEGGGGDKWLSCESQIFIMDFTHLKNDFRRPSA